MEGAARSVEGAVTEASRVSQEVRANIAEIAAGLGEISASVQDVSGLAGKLGEASARLDAAVNAFTTMDAEGDGGAAVIRDSRAEEDSKVETDPVPELSLAP